MPKDRFEHGLATPRQKQVDSHEEGQKDCTDDDPDEKACQEFHMTILLLCPELYNPLVSPEIKHAVLSVRYRVEAATNPPGEKGFYAVWARSSERQTAVRTHPSHVNGPTVIHLPGAAILGVSLWVTPTAADRLRHLDGAVAC